MLELLVCRCSSDEDLRQHRQQSSRALIPSPQTSLHMRGRPPRQQRAPSSTKAQLMVAKHSFEALDGAVSKRAQCDAATTCAGAYILAAMESVAMELRIDPQALFTSWQHRTRVPTQTTTSFGSRSLISQLGVALKPIPRGELISTGSGGARLSLRKILPVLCALCRLSTSRGNGLVGKALP